MKRTAILGVAALFTAVLAGQAWGEPAVTPLREVSDTGWIDGSNLLKAQDADGYYITDVDGNALTPSGYSSSMYCENGYVSAYKPADNVNCEGLLSPQGTEIIEFRYGDIKVPNEHWAAAFVLTPADANNYDYESWFSGDDGDKYYLIETVDFYHLADGTAALAGSFARENCMDYSARGDYLAVEDRTSGEVKLYDSAFNVVAEGLDSVYTDVDGILTEDYEIFSDNGQQGVKDKDGNVLIEPAYRYVYDIKNGYARVSTGDFYGLLDMNGNVIVPAEADELVSSYVGPASDGGSSYVCAGYAAAIMDGKLAFYDLEGNQTVAPTLVKDLVEVNGASATYSDLEGKTHILAADGVDTVLDDAHKDVRALNYGSGLLYEFKDEDYNKGLIDWHGNEILPMGQYSVELSGDGQYLLNGTDYENGVLYTVDYGTGSAAAAPAEAAPAGETPAEEAPADAAPAGDSQADGVSADAA